MKEAIDNIINEALEYTENTLSFFNNEKKDNKIDTTSKPLIESYNKEDFSNITYNNTIVFGDNLIYLDNGSATPDMNEFINDVNHLTSYEISNFFNSYKNKINFAVESFDIANIMGTIKPKMCIVIKDNVYKYIMKYEDTLYLLFIISDDPTSANYIYGISLKEINSYGYRKFIRIEHKPTIKYEISTEKLVK